MAQSPASPANTMCFHGRKPPVLGANKRSGEADGDDESDVDVDVDALVMMGWELEFQKSDRNTMLSN